ncbi:MAG: hypothetical protein JRG91_06170 [Deltaproteobacteria bacterium]|nr:hypothetical protein [Deltaproteobacteria bacterium]
MRWILVPLLLLLGACGESRSKPTDAGEDVIADVQEEVVVTPGFEADPEPEGPGVYVDVDVTDPDAPVATVWAADMGPVFGIALHVTLDGTHVAAHDAAIEPCLGSDSAGEAEYLVGPGASDVSLGAVRRGPDAGEVEITAPVLVATIPLTVVAHGASRVEVTSVQVRRADGSFTAIEVAGGLLTTGGVP